MCTVISVAVVIAAVIAAVIAVVIINNIATMQFFTGVSRDIQPKL